VNKSFHYKCNFSYDHYFEVLDYAKKEEYHIGPIKDYMRLKKENKIILLRHDVDFSLYEALTLAKLENKKKIISTYYFLLQSTTYNALDSKTSSLIKQIAEYGHEIGLHYDTRLAKNKQELLKQIDMMSGLLEMIAGKKIFSIAQHNTTISPAMDTTSSKKFLDARNPSILKSLSYISDSVQNWRSGCMCNHIGIVDKLQILTHPIWWNKKPALRTDILKVLETDKKSDLKKMYYETYLQHDNYIKNLKEGKIT